MVSYIKHLQGMTVKTVWKIAAEIQQERQDKNHPKKDDLEDIFNEAKEEFAKLPVAGDS